MNYLASTDFLDYESKIVQDYISEFKQLKSDKEKAIKLYYKVRDGFLYDPYHLDLRPQALKASRIIGKKRAWCVEKSIVMATCLRGLKIPAKLGYGIVVNHIGVEKLQKYLKRPEIVFHGYVELLIENKWIKITPAFDPLVCRISKVPTLDWDGDNDAMFQEYLAGNKFMEYIHFYGTFNDVPVTLMNAEMKKYYPHLFDNEYNSKEFSFFHI